MEIFINEIELCTVKPRKIELRFFEIPTNSKQISNRLESENIGPVYELFKILCFVCVKETSPRDVSFMHTKYLFDREINTDNNHF